MVSASLCRDWDALAVSIGVTPKFNPSGQVMPLGEPENPNVPDSKKKIHVVWVGRAVGLFHNWGLTSAMVLGFSGASHKAFVGLENARTAWEQGPTRYEGTWKPPKAWAPVATPHLAPAPNPVEDNEDNEDNFVFPDVLQLGTRAPPVQVPILPEDYQQLHTETSRFPSSPSISTTSILSTPSWMSSGTLSPSTVASADLTPIMGNLSLGERFTHVDGQLSSTIAARSGGSPRTSSTAHSTPDSGSFTLIPSPVNARPRTGDSQASRPLLDKKSAAKRVKGDPVYVVVRGDYPGVFFDHATVLCAGGQSAGMKIVRFRSLKIACLYFVQQYMAGNVGVPVFVVADEEDM